MYGSDKAVKLNISNSGDMVVYNAQQQRNLSLQNKERKSKIFCFIHLHSDFKINENHKNAYFNRVYQ